MASLTASLFVLLFGFFAQAKTVAIVKVPDVSLEKYSLPPKPQCKNPADSIDAIVEAVEQHSRNERLVRIIDPDAGHQFTDPTNVQVSPRTNVKVRPDPNKIIDFHESF